MGLKWQEPLYLYPVMLFVICSYVAYMYIHKLNHVNIFLTELYTLHVVNNSVESNIYTESFVYKFPSELCYRLSEKIYNAFLHVYFKCNLEGVYMVLHWLFVFPLWFPGYKL